MKPKKILCLLIAVLTVFMLTTPFSYTRAEEETDEDSTRTSAQIYPYYNPYNWQYSPYTLYGGLYPYGYGYGYGYGYNMFGIQNLYYPINLQGTNFVFQAPFAQIAPFIGATTFWKNQFPNANWNMIMPAYFLGLFNLPGLPYLF